MIAFAVESLECGVCVVEKRDDDVAVLWGRVSLDHHVVAVEDSVFNHGSSFYLENVRVHWIDDEVCGNGHGFVLLYGFDRLAGGDEPGEWEHNGERGHAFWFYEFDASRFTAIAGVDDTFLAQRFDVLMNGGWGREAELFGDFAIGWRVAVVLHKAFNTVEDFALFLGEWWKNGHRRSLYVRIIDERKTNARGFVWIRFLW